MHGYLFTMHEAVRLMPHLAISCMACVRLLDGTEAMTAEFSWWDGLHGLEGRGCFADDLRVRGNMCA